MAQKKKTTKRLSLFDWFCLWLSEPAARRYLEAVERGEIDVEGEEAPPERPMYTIGECVVFARPDETPEQFSNRLDRAMAETARKWSPVRSLEGIDESLARILAEIERLEESIEYYESEIAGLQDHADWLAGQAAKLRAERIRLEAEGLAAVAGVEEMLGL